MCCWYVSVGIVVGVYFWLWLFDLRSIAYIGSLHFDDEEWFCYVSLYFYWRRYRYLVWGSLACLRVEQEAKSKSGRRGKKVHSELAFSFSVICMHCLVLLWLLINRLWSMVCNDDCSYFHVLSTLIWCYTFGTNCISETYGCLRIATKNKFYRFYKCLHLNHTPNTC